MGQQVTGIVKVFVNGSLLRSKEGAKLATGGKERTAITGHSVYGYSEKIVPASIECTLAHMADTDLGELNDLTGATARFETDVGITYLITNAWTSAPVELTGGEGEVSLNLMGDPAKEE